MHVGLCIGNVPPLLKEAVADETKWLAEESKGALTHVVVDHLFDRVKRSPTLDSGRPMGADMHQLSYDHNVEPGILECSQVQFLLTTLLNIFYITSTHSAM